jgi:hypothetical protein
VETTQNLNSSEQLLLRRSPGKPEDTSDRRMLTTQGLAIFANVATIPGGGGGQYQFPW